MHDEGRLVADRLDRELVRGGAVEARVGRAAPRAGGVCGDARRLAIEREREGLRLLDPRGLGLGLGLGFGFGLGLGSGLGPGLGLGLGVRLVHPRLERDPRAHR